MISLNDWGRVLVSIIVTSGFMGILVLVVTTKTAGNSPTEVMLVMLGALGAAFGQVVSYWVGSSSGSAQKDAAIQDMAKK
jgi:protein-S-isoprenylcysteine O-methyltransferase Ste14